ncbi:MAG: BREX system ATP-binding domain-containing protein, partial [Dehalococcoidia bacterium]
RATLIERLGATAAAAGWLGAVVDSRRTRIHLIDRLFHEIAAQVDWDATAAAVLRRLLVEAGYRLPDSGSVRLIDIAAARDTAPSDLAEFDLRISDLLIERVYRNYDLSYEFRLAMLRLCQGLLHPGGTRADEAALVKRWLRGAQKSMTPLKSALIYQRIARHNARHMLASLAHWAHLAGMSGLALCLDISRYTDAARPAEPDGSLSFSTAAALDAYEVLRQFIDATDELAYCFIAVVAARSFLEDERRGLDRYDALKLRIWEEVHDRRRVNPLAALMRVAPEPEVREAAAGELPSEEAPW